MTAAKPCGLWHPKQCEASVPHGAEKQGAPA